VAGFFRLRDDLYSLGLFVHAAWRGRGLTYELMAVGNPALLARGYREIISIQRLDNRASITMTDARGIARVGTLERRCRLGRVSVRFEPL
jgi:L-amino acid N-acyltransferase YncA